MQHKQALNKAEVSLATSLQTLEKDYHRPHYHASPKINWMNDPNGLIYYNNAYHLYYQHNPYSVDWGNIHWGHMKSSNLVNWEHLPLALAPSESYDQDGCFSGSAIEHDGKLYVFYTANIYTSEQGLPDDLLQQQCLAVSSDGGVTFEKYANNPIISSPPPEIGQNNHFRDPKVWSHNGKWYMVLGTKKNGRGKVLLYRSSNLYDWTYMSVLIESDGSMGHMYECPDLFSLNGHDILLFSPEGMLDYPVSGYYVGKLNYETGHYEHGEFQLLDHGFNFYAPQTFIDGSGRRIVIGWMPMKGSELNKQWSGSMSVPRELSLNDDKLIMQPVNEILLQRTKQILMNEFTLADEQKKVFESRSTVIQATFNLTKCTAKEFGITFFASNEEHASVGYDTSKDAIYIDFSQIKGSTYSRKYCTLNQADHTKLKILLLIDNSTVEVFINDGETVLSSLVFPSYNSSEVSLFSKDGSVLVDQLHIWSK